MGTSELTHVISKEVRRGSAFWTPGRTGDRLWLRLVPSPHDPEPGVADDEGGYEWVPSLDRATKLEAAMAVGIALQLAETEDVSVEALPCG